LHKNSSCKHTDQQRFFFFCGASFFSPRQRLFTIVVYKWRTTYAKCPKRGIIHSTIHISPRFGLWQLVACVLRSYHNVLFSRRSFFNFRAALSVFSSSLKRFILDLNISLVKTRINHISLSAARLSFLLGGDYQFHSAQNMATNVRQTPEAPPNVFHPNQLCPDSPFCKWPQSGVLGFGSWLPVFFGTALLPHL